MIRKYICLFLMALMLCFSLSGCTKRIDFYGWDNIQMFDLDKFSYVKPGMTREEITKIIGGELTYIPGCGTNFEHWYICPISKQWAVVMVLGDYREFLEEQEGEYQWRLLEMWILDFETAFRWREYREDGSLEAVVWNFRSVRSFQLQKDILPWELEEREKRGNPLGQWLR